MPRRAPPATPSSSALLSPDGSAASALLSPRGGSSASAAWRPAALTPVRSPLASVIRHRATSSIDMEELWADFSLEEGAAQLADSAFGGGAAPAGGAGGNGAEGRGRQRGHARNISFSDFRSFLKEKPRDGDSKPGEVDATSNLSKGQQQSDAMAAPPPRRRPLSRLFSSRRDPTTSASPAALDGPSIGAAPTIIPGSLSSMSFRGLQDTSPSGDVALYGGIVRCSSVETKHAPLSARLAANDTAAAPKSPLAVAARTASFRWNPGAAATGPSGKSLSGKEPVMVVPFTRRVKGASQQQSQESSQKSSQQSPSSSQKRRGRRGRQETKRLDESRLNEEARIVASRAEQSEAAEKGGGAESWEEGEESDDEGGGEGGSAALSGPRIVFRVVQSPRGRGAGQTGAPVAPGAGRAEEAEAGGEAGEARAADAALENARKTGASSGPRGGFRKTSPRGTAASSLARGVGTGESPSGADATEAGKPAGRTAALGNHRESKAFEADAAEVGKPAGSKSRGRRVQFSDVVRVRRVLVACPSSDSAGPDAEPDVESDDEPDRGPQKYAAVRRNDAYRGDRAFPSSKSYSAGENAAISAEDAWRPAAMTPVRSPHATVVRHKATASIDMEELWAEVSFEECAPPPESPVTPSGRRRKGGRGGHSRNISFSDFRSFRSAMGATKVGNSNSVDKLAAGDVIISDAPANSAETTSYFQSWQLDGLVAALPAGLPAATYDSDSDSSLAKTAPQPIAPQSPGRLATLTRIFSNRRGAADPLGPPSRRMSDDGGAAAPRSGSAESRGSAWSTSAAGADASREAQEHGAGEAEGSWDVGILEGGVAGARVREAEKVDLEAEGSWDLGFAEGEAPDALVGSFREMANPRLLDSAASSSSCGEGRMRALEAEAAAVALPVRGNNEGNVGEGVALVGSFREMAGSMGNGGGSMGALEAEAAAVALPSPPGAAGNGVKQQRADRRVQFNRMVQVRRVLVPSDSTDSAGSFAERIREACAGPAAEAWNDCGGAGASGVVARADASSTADMVPANWTHQSHKFQLTQHASKPTRATAPIEEAAASRDETTDSPNSNDDSDSDPISPSGLPFLSVSPRPSFGPAASTFSPTTSLPPNASLPHNASLPPTFPHSSTLPSPSSHSPRKFSSGPLFSLSRTLSREVSIESSQKHPRKFTSGPLFSSLSRTLSRDVSVDSTQKAPSKLSSGPLISSLTRTMSRSRFKHLLSPLLSSPSKPGTEARESAADSTQEPRHSRGTDLGVASEAGSGLPGQVPRSASAADAGQGGFKARQNWLKALRVPRAGVLGGGSKG
ncbi:unnamed protein product [Closterium sp. Yama58-4]|nr:unnamed protein product [Closterium sp. Yama58-4]